MLLCSCNLCCCYHMLCIFRTIDDLFPEKKRYCATARPVDDADRSAFARQLDSFGKFQAFAWLMAPEPADKEQLPACTLSGLFLKDEYKSLTNEQRLPYLCSGLALTQSQVHNIQTATIGQASNPLWTQYRKGRVTASNFGPVLTTIDKMRKPSKSLIKTLVEDQDLPGVHSLQWGRTHESVAINAYKLLTGVDVAASGVWLSVSGLLGGSPDGIVDDQKIIEVKCPYSARQTTLASLASSGKPFFLKVVDGNLCLNTGDPTGHKYWHQMQGNMYLTDRQECDLIVWTPAETVVSSVKKDPDWSSNIAKLERFCKEHVLPALINANK